MNYPTAELRCIWKAEYSSQKSEFIFEDILPPFWILDSYPEAKLRGILLIKISAGSSEKLITKIINEIVKIF